MKRFAFALMVPVVLGAPMAAQANEPLDRTKETIAQLTERAQGMIAIGGVLVCRYRHTISGAAMGCATGSLVGMSPTLVLSPITGGATLAGTAPAALVGCTIGAAGGAALGYQLDTMAPTLDGLP